MRRAMTVLLVILLIVILILALCEFLIHFALDRQAFWTLERALYPPKRLKAEAEDPDVIWFLESSTEVCRQSPDGLRLSARLLPGDGSHRWVLAFHGYCNRPTAMSLYSRHFHAQGFTVLAPSARAHGDSEGRWIGMGWPERLDAVDWTSWILEQDPQAQICLFGTSMGAATVCTTAGEQLPAAVRCGISDSSFTSVWDEFLSQMERVFHIPMQPVLWLIDRMAAPRTGWDFREASPEKQLQKARMPMLFLHGEKDRFVPYAMLDRVSAACGSAVKEACGIPEAGHCRGVSVNPELYWSVVDGFLERVFSDGGPAERDVF